MAKKSEAATKLDQIKDILFPPVKIHETVEEGEKLRYMVDYSVDNNLYSVLLDLQEGNNDEICQNTLNKCIKAMDKVRKILEVNMQLDDGSKYIVVEMLDDGLSIDEIE